MEELKSFPLSEVTLHSSKSDCWLTIHGKVYDVTNFLEEHPGGEDVLLESAAKGDATNDFEDVGHSSTATSMLSSYLIGTLDRSSSKKGDVGQQSSNGVKNVAAKTATLERQVSSSSSSMRKFIVPFISLVVAFVAWYYYSHSGKKACCSHH
ncbi:hypothetical protein MKW98_026477 [Papaver atlanticum]|uniref:Cytochrome b5 heme-binding domain-containing protein n=1 Tax=Papaver atlanticum TaxID=357466 RepID=A0AAD4SEL3_9MAGN|nr:hypothetical protein MKW98_026477 [Papaver atlanticum]